MKSKLNLEVSVDSYELERLAFGGMMYDVLTYRQIGDGARINRNSAINYDSDTKTIQIQEDKLLEIIKLANKPCEATGLGLV